VIVLTTESSVGCLNYYWALIAFIFISELKVKVMKKLILSFVIAVSTLTMSFASNGPVGPGVLSESLNVFKTAEVEFYLTTASQRAFFTHADFNTETNNLEFVTKDDIKYLQIFEQNGKLLYQLPVMSNKLKISRKVFKQGIYKVGFIVQGGNNIQFSNLKFN